MSLPETSAAVSISNSPAAPHCGASEWGLASLLLGITVLLMAPPMTVVMILAALGNLRWTANDVRLIALLSVLPMICLLGLAAFGVVAALKGIKAGRAQHHATGLATSGLCACAGAILFTVLNFLGGFFIADDLIQQRTFAQPPAANSPLTISVPAP